MGKTVYGEPHSDLQYWASLLKSLVSYFQKFSMPAVSTTPSSLFCGHIPAVDSITDGAFLGFHCRHYFPIVIQSSPSRGLHQSCHPLILHHSHHFLWPHHHSPVITSPPCSSCVCITQPPCSYNVQRSMHHTGYITQPMST